MKEKIEHMNNGLQSVISDNTGLSVGESQLLCIARALLKPCKVLLIDEATSSVDHDTDTIIQRVFRTQFEGVTVLTIAHRLQTILHCDRILVLRNGQVVEFDTVENLLNKDPNEDGTAVFAGMYEHAARFFVV